RGCPATTRGWAVSGSDRPSPRPGSVLERRQLSTGRAECVPGGGPWTYLEVTAHVQQEHVEEVELLDSLDQVAVLVEHVNRRQRVVVRRRAEEVRRRDLLHQELVMRRIRGGVLVGAAAEGQRGRRLA